MPAQPIGRPLGAAWQPGPTATSGSPPATRATPPALYSITTAGTITTHPLTPGIQPASLITGPDGNLRFTDTTGRLAKATTSGTVIAAQMITSSASDTETSGVPFSFAITTTGNPAPKITKSGTLPPGVTFTDNGNGTATITGTPPNPPSAPTTAP